MMHLITKITLFVNNLWIRTALANRQRAVPGMMLMRKNNNLANYKKKQQQPG